MSDITIPDAAQEAAYHQWRRIDPIIGTGDIRLIIAAAAPHIAAQEREAVAEEIDLAAVMEHLLNDGTRDGLILADKINVAVGASRVRRMRLLASIEEA